jgi:fatty acid desaturase
VSSQAVEQQDYAAAMIDRRWREKYRYGVRGLLMTLGLFLLMLLVVVVVGRYFLTG